MARPPSRTWARDTARILSTAVALCLLAPPLPAAEEDVRILILNSSDPSLPAYVAIDSAMRGALAKGTARPIDYFSETLDALRFRGQTFQPEFVALLDKKYEGLRIDVVVAVGQSAFDIAVHHRDRLWPGARIVFYGVSARMLETVVLPGQVTGVVARRDVGGTIDLALRLQPHARRMLVVSGASELGREFAEQARTEAIPRAGRTAVEFLSGWPLADLVRRVEQEPPDSVVIYLAVDRDRDGRPYTSREVLRAMAAVSPAPVFGFIETYVGFGIAAGSIESLQAVGERVADLVQQALAGGSSAPGPTLRVGSSRCMADARALRRWSLDQRRLPADCEIRFGEPPFWRRYLWPIAAVLAVVIGQTVLILSMVAQRRRRRLAERSVETLQSDLARASRFAIAGELTASIAHEINQPLGAILSNVETADLIVQSGADRREVLRQILAEVAARPHPRGGPPRRPEQASGGGRTWPAALRRWR